MVPYFADPEIYSVCYIHMLCAKCTHGAILFILNMAERNKQLEMTQNLLCHVLRNVRISDAENE